MTRTYHSVFYHWSPSGRYACAQNKTRKQAVTFTIRFNLLKFESLENDHSIGDQNHKNFIYLSFLNSMPKPYRMVF